MSERLHDLDDVAAEFGVNLDGHWLLFDGDRPITMTSVDGYGPIVGCHCGFRADVDADCGFGDSVVAHLLALAAVPDDRTPKEKP